MEQDRKWIVVWAACTVLSLGTRSPGGGGGGLLRHGWDLGRFAEPSPGVALASCSAAFRSVRASGLCLQKVKVRGITSSTAAGSAPGSAPRSTPRAAGRLLRVCPISFGPCGSWGRTIAGVTSKGCSTRMKSWCWPFQLAAC